MSDASKIETLLTENLDVWTNAIERRSTAGGGRSKKFSLYGIEKLRSLILDLAVRGKLVPQVEGDEPAVELLKRIASKKNGKSVRTNSMANELQQSAWQLPKGWTWTTFEQITSYIQRGKGPKYDDAGSTLVLSQKCVQWSGLDIEAARRISDSSTAAYNEMRFLSTGDILWNSTGTGTVGRAIVFEMEPEQRAVADSHLTLVRPLLVSPDFMVAFIASTAVQSRMQPDHASPLVSGTTNQVELNTSSVRSLEFPLPPLAEQHRIVAKVDELMALCDALEAGTYDALEAHGLLVKELLTTLTSSQNAEDFAQNWTRIETHFDALFTTEDSIDQLKQTIMQLAVMGKLVPQDQSDEPAAALLKKVNREREKLALERKINARRSLPKNEKIEEPYALPDGWQWCRLADIAIIGTGTTPSRTRSDYYHPAEIAWVTSGETDQQIVLDTKERVSETALRETSLNLYPEGTLLIALYGQGKTRGQVTELGIPAATNQACAAIQLLDSSHEHRKYVRLFLEFSYHEIRSQSAGGAQPNLNVGKVENYLVPLPPFGAQRRIADKVDQLFALCDSFKMRLSQAQNQQVQFADAIASRAVA